MMRKGPAAALLLALSLPGPISAQTVGGIEHPEAGLYDGRQMEIAAVLELGADGRYRYELSYGALDEASAGTWEALGDGAVVLTSDPSTPPAFEKLGEGKGPKGVLTIDLDLPEGFAPQLFTVVVSRADGTASFPDFAGPGLAVPASGSPIVSVRLAFPMFEVAGEEVVVEQADGRRLRFAFRPNDLGFARFDHLRLPFVDGAYVLERYERELRFRRVATGAD